MWVYQESVPNALTAPSGALPAAQPVAAPRDTAPFRKESASPSDTLSGPGQDGCPGAAKAAARSRTLPRDCAVLAASYLFGTLLAGVVLARCQSSEQLLVSAYLDSWKGLFTLDEPGAVWRLFGAEYLTVTGGATVLLLLGLSAFGPLMIYLFAMLFGLGTGIIGLELVLQASWQQAVATLALAGLPTAAAVTCLCLFGASALRVSGRLQRAAFGAKSGTHAAGARRLLGQYLALNVFFLPVCGISTALACLAGQLGQI